MANPEKALNIFQKDVNVSGYAATGVDVVGSPLVRQDLEAEILKLTDRDTPIRDVIKRIKGEGRAHAWNQRTSLGRGSNPLNLGYADGGLPTQSDPLYVQKTAAYKYLGITAVMTGAMLATARSYTDLEAEVAEAKLREMIQGEEWMMINGSAGAVSTTFDGFGVQIVTNTINAAGLPMTNMDNVDTIIKKIRLQGGKPDMLGVSFGMQAIINRILMPDIRYIANQGTTVTAGIYATNYQSPAGTLPIVGSFNINPASPYPYNTSSSSSNDGAPESTIYVLDSKQIELVQLQPIGRTELAKIADTVRFYINEYAVLAVKAEAWQGKITNVSDPAS